MSIDLGLLMKGVHLPSYEQMRFAPFTSGVGTATCYGEGVTEKYLYAISGQTFYRLDLEGNVWQPLSSCNTGASINTTLRYSSFGGFRGNVLGVSGTTMTVAGLRPSLFLGQTMRITDGKGIGQERTVVSAGQSKIHAQGVATTAGTTSIADTTQKWAINEHLGKQCRIVFGGGVTQIRKIIYNSTNTLYFYDVNYQQLEPFNNTSFATTTPFTAPNATAGTQTHFFIETVDITLNAAWDVGQEPDEYSSFVLLSGGIWKFTSATGAPWTNFEYYDVLSDTWTPKTAVSSHLLAAYGTDFAIERTGEAGGAFFTGDVTSAGARYIVDNTKTWELGRYENYQVRITDGTGKGQRRKIEASNATRFMVDTDWDIIPDATSKYAVYGNSDRIYLVGGGLSSMFKYNVEKDIWFQGNSTDFGQTINISAQCVGQEAFAISSATRATNGMTSIGITAGGTGYQKGDILSVTAVTSGQVIVTSENGGVVTGVKIFRAGSAGSTGTGKATTGGTGTGCTINIIALGNIGRCTTVQNHNFLTGDVLNIKGCTEAAWNKQYTILGADSLTTFDVEVTATATAVASFSQGTTLMVDATKNWGVNEHVGDLVQVHTAGVSGTIQIRRITANTATTLTLNGAITTAVNGTSRYVITKLYAFGRDRQWRDKLYKGEGFATGGTTTTLVDTTKQWRNNQWAGYVFNIVAGTGKGTDVTIISNTNTTLTYATQTFTPDLTTKYCIQDTFGAVAVATTTTIQDTTKNWTVNMWAGKRVRITAGTGTGQEFTVTSNTNNTLTVSATWTTTPDTTSCYTILTIPQRGEGVDAFWIWGTTYADINGKFILVPRGGNSNAFDIYDITDESWELSKFISPQREQFAAGSMYAYDGKDYIYFTPSQTGFIYRGNILTGQVEGYGYIPIAQGTDTVSANLLGNRMEIYHTADGAKFVWIWRHRATECYRGLIFY